MKPFIPFSKLINIGASGGPAVTIPLRDTATSAVPCNYFQFVVTTTGAGYVEVKFPGIYVSGNDVFLSSTTNVAASGYGGTVIPLAAAGIYEFELEPGKFVTDLTIKAYGAAITNMGLVYGNSEKWPYQRRYHGK